ncbi:MAG: hypothetical protein WDO12_09910 [Pseudomonadota bacterium]
MSKCAGAATSSACPGNAASGAAQVLKDLFELTDNGGTVTLPDVHLALREHELLESADDGPRAAPVDSAARRRCGARAARADPCAR